MRNKLYSVLALCAMVLVSACGDHEVPTFTSDFIAFKGGSRTVSEADPAFDILVTSSAPGAASSVSLGGSAVEGTDYTVSATTVTSGSDYTTTIRVTPIDNVALDGTKTVELTLTDGGFPGGAAGKVYTVTILDDDCPTEVSGSYAATGAALGGNPPDFTMTTTPVAGSDNSWDIDTVWGPNFVGWATGDDGFNGRFLYPGTLTINADRSVDFTGTRGTGTGTYDPCSDTFTLTVNQNLFTTSFTVDVTFVGNGD